MSRSKCARDIFFRLCANQGRVGRSGLAGAVGVVVFLLIWTAIDAPRLDVFTVLRLLLLLGTLLAQLLQTRAKSGEPGLDLIHIGFLQLPAAHSIDVPLKNS